MSGALDLLEPAHAERTEQNVSVPEPHVRRQIAVAAMCAENTVKDYFLDPTRTKPVTRRRIELALQKLGLAFAR